MDLIQVPCCLLTCAFRFVAHSPNLQIYFGTSICLQHAYNCFQKIFKGGGTCFPTFNSRKSLQRIFRVVQKALSFQNLQTFSITTDRHIHQL